MVVSTAKTYSTTSENVDRATKLFSEYGGFIRSVIHYNIKNYELTEDIFQDLFIHFVVKPIPEDVQSTKGFLYKVISDKIKDSIRRIDNYQTRVNRYAKRIRNNTNNSPVEQITDIEESKKMFDLIERTLPEKEAQAVIFKFRDNFDTITIADKMGIKSRSVSRYVSVGIKKLRGIFHESGESKNDCH